MNKVIHTASGKLAKAIVVSDEKKGRVAHITFATGGKLHVPTERINLRAMKADDANEAIDKVCHGTGRISLYEVTEVEGKAALTRTFSSIHEGRETGYGLFIKRGKKAVKFALSRIDLAAMKAKDAVAAMHTAAYTGRIALAPRKG